MQLMQKIEKNESKINWNDKAEKIIAKINALHPNPGTWFMHNDVRHKIIKAIEVKEQGRNYKFKIYNWLLT